MCRQLLPQVNSSLYPFSTLLHASGTIAWRNCKHKSIWTGMSPTADSSCWGPGIRKVCCLMWLPPSTHPTKTCCQQHKKSGQSLSFTDTWFDATYYLTLLKLVQVRIYQNNELIVIMWLIWSKSKDMMNTEIAISLRILTSGSNHQHSQEM